MRIKGFVHLCKDELIFFYQQCNEDSTCTGNSNKCTDGACKCGNGDPCTVESGKPVCSKKDMYTTPADATDADAQCYVSEYTLK